MKATAPVELRKNSVADTVLELIQQRSNVVGDATEEQQAAARLRRTRRISRFIEQKKPIEMVILGFPFKSKNRKKTFSDMPDLAEWRALHSLNQLCEDISRVHAPGAHLTLCSDGHVFSDLVGVPDKSVDAYQACIGDWVREFGFRGLRTFSLYDVYGEKDGETLRGLLASYAPSPDQLSEYLTTTSEGQSLFVGIRRFVFEDQRELLNLSRSKTRALSKETAFSVIQRSQAFSKLVETVYGDAVRLSIHPQPLTSSKIGIRLLPGSNQWATPWHNVLLEKDGAFSLVHHQEAVSAGARLKFHEDRFAYFSI